MWDNYLRLISIWARCALFVITLEHNFFPKIIMAVKKNSRFSSALFPLVHATSYIIHIPKYRILKCEISPKIFLENKSIIITLLLVRLPPPPCYNMLCFSYPPTPPRGHNVICESPQILSKNSHSIKKSKYVVSNKGGLHFQIY